MSVTGAKTGIQAGFSTQASAPAAEMVQIDDIDVEFNLETDGPRISATEIEVDHSKLEAVDQVSKKPLPAGSLAMRVLAPIGTLVGGASAAALGGVAVALAGTAINMAVAAQLDPAHLGQVDLSWALQAGAGGAIAALVGAMAGTATAANATRIGFSSKVVPDEMPARTGLGRLLSGWARTSHKTSLAVQNGRRDFASAESLGGALWSGVKAGAKMGFEAARVAGRWAGAIQGAVLAGMTSGAFGMHIGASAAASLAGAVVGATIAAPAAGGMGAALASVWGGITAFTHRVVFGKDKA